MMVENQHDSSGDGRLSRAADCVLADLETFHTALFTHGFTPVGEAGDPLYELHSSYYIEINRLNTDAYGTVKQPWDAMIALARTIALEHGYVAAAIAMLAGLYRGKRAPPASVGEDIRRCLKQFGKALERSETPGPHGFSDDVTRRIVEDVAECVRRPNDRHRLCRKWSRSEIYKYLGGSEIPHRLYQRTPFWRRALWSTVGGSLAGLALFIVALYIFELHPRDVAFHRLGEMFAAARETSPPIGDDYLLSEAQVRFCVRESMRLTLTRLRNLSSAQTGFLGLTIDNYNLRCASYRAADGLVERLRSEAAGQIGSLEGEVEDRLAAWRALIDRRPSGSRSNDPVALGIEKLNMRNRSHIRRIQEKLRAADVYRGAIDGLWGPSSRRALTAFKRAAGLGANAEWTLAAQRLLF